MKARTKEKSFCFIRKLCRTSFQFSIWRIKFCWSSWLSKNKYSNWHKFVSLTFDWPSLEDVFLTKFQRRIFVQISLLPKEFNGRLLMTCIQFGHKDRFFASAIISFRWRGVPKASNTIYIWHIMLFSLLHSFIASKKINKFLFSFCSSSRVCDFDFLIILHKYWRDDGTRELQKCLSRCVAMLNANRPASNQRCWQRKRSAIYEQKGFWSPPQPITVECPKESKRNAMQKHKNFWYF